MRFSPFLSAALLKVPESVGTGAPRCARPLQRCTLHGDSSRHCRDTWTPLRFAVLTFSLSWLQLRASVGDK